MPRKQSLEALEVYGDRFTQREKDIIEFIFGLSSRTFDNCKLSKQIEKVLGKAELYEDITKQQWREVYSIIHKKLN